MTIDLYLQFLKKHAYRTGDFTLSSGIKSNEYLDVKTAILHPEAGYYLTITCTETIGRDNCDAVAGVVLGGALLAMRIASLRIRPCLAVRTKPKNHGLDVAIEGLENIKNNDKIWLIEDVVTSGNETIKALNSLINAAGLIVDNLLVIVDREMGGTDAIKKEFPGLNVHVLSTLSKIREA